MLLSLSIEAILCTLHDGKILQRDDFISEGPVTAEVPAIQSAVTPDASAAKRKIIKLANGNEVDLDSIKVSCASL